ncbi:MAG: cytochrome c biogenesis protein ResB [Micavibrio sp.]|nr:cytochrome c biogenesis protein ResB [Micavibrio sp.]
MALNLSCKLIFKSPWKREQAGIIITHIAVLLLLVGGLLTALFSTESYLDFAEGEVTSQISDYHARELTVLDESAKPQYVIAFNDIADQDKIPLINAPFTIEVLERCGNCEITRRSDGNERFIGMAKNMSLKPKPPERENERNMAGLTLKINIDGEEQIHTVLEDIPILPKFEAGGKRYSLALTKLKRTLPFKVELIDFTREEHPGTDMAKAYSSHVRIIDGVSSWESVISMNEPLRYKGYTLFQSSFISTPDGDVSVLAVVWNVGRAFPYISGLVMCLGIIVHLIVRRKKA